MQLGEERREAGSGDLGEPTVLVLPMIPRSATTPFRSIWATTPNSARWARIALITAVCCRTKGASGSCCPGVLVATNRMLVLVTASQIASASAASFFCRLT